MCLKSAAFAFADDFDCPSCGNKDEFQRNMAMNGIYVPKNDYSPNYCPQIDVEEEEETTQKPKRRRIHKNWALENTFPNKKDAIEAVTSEKCRHNYRCNAMKFRGKQCDAGVYLLYDSRNSSVHLYRCELPHSHDNEECKQNARNTIPIEIETAIRALFKQNVKPKAILYKLVLKGHQPPYKARLTTIVAYASQQMKRQ